MSAETRITQGGDLGAAKIMGGLGVIFSILAAIPYIGLIFGLAGLILIILANKKISEVVGDGSIFSNTWKAMVINFLAVLIGVIVMAAGAAASQSYYGSGEGLASFGVILGVVIAYIGYLISGYLLFKVYKKIAEYFNSDIFKWGAYLILIGYVLFIILIGAFVAAIGWLLIMVGYFTLPKYYEKVEIG